MSALTRFEQLATDLRPAQRSRLADVISLSELEGRRWKQLNEQLRETGDPTALVGGFAGLEVTPPPASSALVTINATEAAIIPTALMPMAANPQVPKLYRLFASGTSTTAATPGTFTLTSRIGPAPTNASPVLTAATSAITPVASATAAPWRLEGFVLVRTGGASSVAAASFEFNMSATVGGGGPASATSNAVLGGVSSTYDSTAATALWLGAIATTSTTNTFTPQIVAWGSWN